MMFEATDGPRPRLLGDGFLKSLEAYPGRPAVEVEGEVLTYSALFAKAASLAATMMREKPGEAGPALTAVFASRSATAYAGILAALMRGHGYVPLNRTFPTERTKAMLRRSKSRTVIVDRRSEAQLDRVLDGLDEGLTVLLPERSDVTGFESRWRRHRFVGAGGFDMPERWAPVGADPDDVAYLLFTSGSTGVPKGVRVSHRNVRHYIDFVADRFAVVPEDRFSQLFDLTFDLSVSDMFVAWERGGCVCCPSERSLVNPGRFINDARLTVWFSVPSTAQFMKRLGALKAGAYSGLRLSLFCGEALPTDLAASWAAAAPRSMIENFYGPTELTIACTHYRWDPDRTPRESVLGLVPIGEAFPEMRALVVDESLREVEPGGDGELLMAGPQVTLGYLDDPDRTAAAFVRPPGRPGTYYRTGDRVRRPAAGGTMLFLGRVDDQIKILGHRVELGEVETVVREESGVDGVVALGWPRGAGSAGGVEVFLQGEGPAEPGLAERIAGRLPFYMVPRRFHFLESFPLNASGKIDRAALAKRLETGS